MKKLSFSLFLLSVGLFSLSSLSSCSDGSHACASDGLTYNPNSPLLNTNELGVATQTSFTVQTNTASPSIFDGADFQGVVISDDYDKVVAMATSAETLLSNCTYSSVENGSFTNSFKELVPGATYYVMSFVYRKEDVLYTSRVISVKVPGVDELIATEGDLDFGLEVDWSTRNVGATAPEQAGKYFAWGETESKSSYSWSNYKYGTKTNLGKYNTNSKYGRVDNEATLVAADDAATASLGSGYRMPTSSDWKKLQNNTNWTYVCYKGVYGYLVTKDEMEKGIFLPATGLYSDSNLSYEKFGFYWSSDLSDLYTDNASDLYFTNKNVKLLDHNRANGRCIRAVKIK